MRLACDRTTPWGGDGRRNLPSPRQCGGLRSDHPTPGDGPRPDQPTGYMDPLDGGRRPHGTRLSRRGRSPRRSYPRGARDLGHLGCCCDARAFGRDVLAGVRRSRGAPRGRPEKTTVFSWGQDRRGRHFGDGADGQDPMASRCGSDVAPILPPPRDRCGRSLRAAVAPVRRTRPPDRLASREPLAPSTPSVRGRARGVVFRWGSKWGSPGEHRAMRFGHEPSVATDFRAEEGLVVAPALPGNDRGARPRGDAGTASRKGKALEGRHRRESAEAVAGMRPRGAATR